MEWTTHGEDTHLHDGAHDEEEGEVHVLDVRLGGGPPEARLEEGQVRAPLACMQWQHHHCISGAGTYLGHL